MSTRTTKRWIAVAGALLLAALLSGVLLAGTANAQGYRFGGGQGMYGMMGGGVMGGMMGPGMMGGRTGYAIGATTPYTYPSFSGWGMHGMMGPGMMGGWGYPGTPIAIDQAVEAVEQYLVASGNPDLVPTEVMEFGNNFYAEVEEESTGIHAFELLINRYTGAIYPEPGPNMMWNTKYGHMGGMMGGWWGGSPAGEMTVTPEQARTLAQQYLDAYLPGTGVDEVADRFYGYYTIHTLRDGQIAGMLSVNGYTGQVWVHNWHGDFIGMQAPGE